jgi:nicotinate-nucleotide adenylyltransferase
MRVGLLGGSFNPAHDGHVHVSAQAMKRLGLDAVWWLVSPQNPMKPESGMAPFADRLAGAQEIASRHPGIVATDLEDRLGTRFTADTLEALVRAFPGVAFVWLMGADNLAQLPRWRRWAAIFGAVPVAVFDRAPYSLRALAGQAAKRFARHRVAERAAGRLPGMAPPAWVFLHTPLHPASASEIRARRGRAPRRAPARAAKRR